MITHPHIMRQRTHVCIGPGMGVGASMGAGGAHANLLTLPMPLHTPHPTHPPIRPPAHVQMCIPPSTVGGITSFISSAGLDVALNSYFMPSCPGLKENLDRRRTAVALAGMAQPASEVSKPTGALL